MIVLNTKYESAGRVVLEDALKGIKINRNDRDYSKYDTAIFMAPDSEVKYAKGINPRIQCIIFDPKTNNFEDVKLADLLIVSSIEQREFFLKYNKNIYIYNMFPDIKGFNKKHQNKKKLIIGYHGNRLHLEEMRELTLALNETFNIELWAIYNIKKLGKWTKNLPNCPVKHIQWTPECKELKECDIGVVPSIIPVWKFWKWTYNYINTYKLSNNPGRIWVFAQFGIPVITDFTPSACQVIKDSHNGILVGSKEGWMRAIELLRNVALRNKLSYNLRKELKKSKNPFQ